MTNLGIDIDGVLNDHRSHFCNVLRSVVGKHLDEAGISVIPVHRMPDSGVTEADEHAVFNWPRYWTEMPPIREPVGEIVRQLVTAYGARVCVFTSRSWPNPKTIPVERQGAYWNEWSRISSWARLGRLQHMPAVRKAMEVFGLSEWINRQLIVHVTVDWLRRHGIEYQELVIERHGSTGAGERGGVRDRFAYADKYRFWVFVEDNRENAARLAANCDFVFLIDHPYNRKAEPALPRNVIRVTSWKEIRATLSRGPVV